MHADFTQSVSLYVHIPFCKAKCTYCAFNIYVGLERLIEPYVEALRREIGWVARQIPGQMAAAHTLYLGGGTPSMLDPVQIASIIGSCRSHFNLLPQAEITLEANPESVTGHQLAAWRDAGVNRLSIGVQSVHMAELALFGRKHTVEQAFKAYRLARLAGFDNISVDLIYGAPGQSRQSWQETLDTVLAWNPDHISLYSLSVESKTALAHWVKRGRIPAPDDDLAADMYDDARELLARVGFEQYEIANWARPGFTCQHNRQYWINQPFLGFGAGAHGAANGIRYWNVRPISKYIARIDQAPDSHPDGKGAFPRSPAVDDFQVVTDDWEMAETVILQLRLVQEGVRKADFARRFGCEVDDVFGEAITRLEKLGLLSSDGQVIRLTERAYLIGNQVFVQFIPENT
jgi:oxygen-independent coproporphyrinogen-3 oxidase